MRRIAFDCSLSKCGEECIKADEELTEWPPLEEEYKLLEW